MTEKKNEQDFQSSQFDEDELQKKKKNPYPQTRENKLRGAGKSSVTSSTRDESIVTCIP